MSDMKPEISSGKRLSAIWIVPIVASLLGLWMLAYSLINEGPEITITFNNADGLSAGKTKLKLLNVDIGQVTAITLHPDSSSVLVTAKLDKVHQKLLREDTQFWVERARIGAGGVSGLSTILSGAYIQMSPARNQGHTGKRQYVGLESPPLTPADAAGLRIQLESDRASSISTGNIIVYKGYPVGRVESASFDTTTQKNHHDLFIDAPFHTLVNSSVRFWDVGGVKINASAEGFSVDTGSLDTIISGGVTFGLPPGTPPGGSVKGNTVFKLYDSYQDTLEKNYHYGTHYIISVPQSVGGLVPGAPVEYRGINIGTVQRVMINELVANGTLSDIKGGGKAIPILIRVEPARLGLDDSREAVNILRKVINSGVPNGLRATLASGNILTGSLYVNLDYYANQEPLTIGHFDQYDTIPTLPGGLARIEQSIAQVLKKINDLPLGDTVANANDTLVQMRETMASLNSILSDSNTQNLTAQLNETLLALRNTLEGVSPDSPIYEKLANTLSELTTTLQSVNELSRTLSASALLLPTPDEKDPAPKVNH